MERRGLRLRDVADACGVSTGNVSGWRQAEYFPRRDVLPRLAASLGVSEEFLVYGRTNEPAERADVVEEPPVKFSRDKLVAPNYPLPPREPTPEECLEYFRAYLAAASKVPGGIGHAWVQLQLHFPLGRFDEINPKKERNEQDD